VTVKVRLMKLTSRTTINHQREMVKIYTSGGTPTWLSIRKDHIGGVEEFIVSEMFHYPN